MADVFLKEGKCFIVAELSANHGGDIEIAKKTIRAAKKAGADAIKLQTYTADTITLDVKNDYFKIKQGTFWDGKYLYDLYKEAFLPWSWHKELFQLAKEVGLVCFSSPFDKTSIDFLEELGNPIYKIASFEITDIPLIEYAASRSKPVFISIGIADISDIELAIATCKKAGNDNITLLQCTSEYPALVTDANLLTIPDIVKRFGVNAGLSDHTLGAEVPVLGVALGAKVIEKHFILNKEIGGVDAHFSLDEREFSVMVEAIRKAEKIMGQVNYEMTEKKKKSKEFSKSIFVSEDIKKGEMLTEKNIRVIRPGFGLHPKYFKEILGKQANADIKKGTPFNINFIK